jgi:hypothetical protein
MKKYSEDENSLINIINFIRNAWRKIFILGFLGLISGFVFLKITPNKFEAIALIQMAQIISKESLKATNIEQPVTLIARMKLPNSFSAQIVSGCGYPEDPSSVFKLIKDIQINNLAGSETIIKLKVRSSTPELAEKCTNLLFLYIEEYQNEIISKQLEDKKLKNIKQLERNNNQLDLNKILLSKAKININENQEIYFKILKEINRLEDEKDNLEIKNNLEYFQKTKFKAPVYVNNEIVYPKKSTILIASSLMGMLLGILHSLCRKNLIILKNIANHNIKKND